MKKAEDMGFMSYLKELPKEEKLLALAMSGISTDGGHHKQWYLEQIVLLLKGEEFIKKQREKNYYEEGIAP